MKTFKAVSTVIATLLMLIITIALAGTAYFYINSITDQTISVNIGFDSTRTRCSGTDITIVVKNDGTTPVPTDTVFIGGFNGDGGDFTGANPMQCDPDAATQVGAGSTYSCTPLPFLNAGAGGHADQAAVVTAGNNIITVRAGGSSSQISLNCAG